MMNNAKRRNERREEPGLGRKEQEWRAAAWRLINMEMNTARLLRANTIF